ncbi:MAG: mannose-1-phosphate guanylyltransferase, partial [Synechococcaceae cyanobacterium RL_1_2]|nr:mannose-1-phosphate guanylyltransferase [Synechococcaceae cyanobacterium RL_1_2]
MTNTFIPIILAGGKGERFWPLSRLDRPKQFLSLDDTGKSLLQNTADRLLPLAQTWEQLWVVTSAGVADLVKEQLPDLPANSLLIEPEGKDTAPAVAWASWLAQQRYGEDAILGFFPADHWIGNEEKFAEIIAQARSLVASTDAIATLGINPTEPATGYGYIEQGAIADYGAYQVSRFTEKPDRETAEQFLATGKFSWNSGMFIFRAGTVIQELDNHSPALMALIREKGAEAYGQLEKISIDYALMEKTQLAYVIPADFGWDDLGDWNALGRLHPQDQAGNVNLGDHVSLDTHNAIVYGDESNAELIVTIGLDDVVIVRNGNATLIARCDHTQDIKQILKQLQADPRYKEFCKNRTYAKFRFCPGNHDVWGCLGVI